MVADLQPVDTVVSHILSQILSQVSHLRSNMGHLNVLLQL